MENGKGKYRKIFQKLSKKYSIDTIPGSIIEEEKNKFYNTTYYIDRKGKILGRYRKINLWLPEEKDLSSGKNIKVIKTNYGKIGLAICWDLMFPETFKKIKEKGAKIIYCPTLWCEEDSGKNLLYEKKLLNELCIKRARDSNAILIMANAAEDIKIKKDICHPIGQSQITRSNGSIKKLKHSKEKILFYNF